MKDMYFKNLTSKDLERHARLDQMNHAPYPQIILVSAAVIFIFTSLVLVGVF